MYARECFAFCEKQWETMHIQLYLEDYIMIRDLCYHHTREYWFNVNNNLNFYRIKRKWMLAKPWSNWLWLSWWCHLTSNSTFELVWLFKVLLHITVGPYFITMATNYRYGSIYIFLAHYTDSLVVILDTTRLQHRIWKTNCQSRVRVHPDWWCNFQMWLWSFHHRLAL